MDTPTHFDMPVLDNQHVVPSDTAVYHQELLQDPKVLQPSSPDKMTLLPFNGYYNINTSGGFFAVDTNIIVSPDPNDETGESYKQDYDVSLIISLNGTSATRYAFTGTFDGTTLKQHWNESGLDIELTFTRNSSGDYGPVASISGSITLPGQAKTTVSGSTYNNPIPIDVYAGSYFYSKTTLVNPPALMKIHADNKLEYDASESGGHLSVVPRYIYNMNMYFFTFMQGTKQVNLIMGTAGNKGFACNDMTTPYIDNKPAQDQTTSRPLVTFPHSPQMTPTFNQPSPKGLADFSGYYPLTFEGSTAGAFISIQGQYVTDPLKTPTTETYYVLISYSTDGETVQAHYFDANTMSFSNGKLEMPNQGITINFERKYDPTHLSLVTFTGTMSSEVAIYGYTLFNPVPLEAFAGQPLTNSKGDILVVNSDNTVTYTDSAGTTTTNGIIYVPLMYILAYPIIGTDLVMSFGTDGAHGNACIVTRVLGKDDDKITSVWSIPN